MRLIEIPSWGSANLLEIVWLASGVLALFIAGLRIRPLIRDFRIALATRERDLYVIARGYFRREVIRLSQAVAIISIGVYTAQEPQLLPGPARTSITGLVLTAVLLVISLLVSLQSVLDWRDREEVRRLQGRL
jgi:hypothetical protein